MNVNHLDARAVTQPGGLYASANNGILEALKAYFQFKDRQQAGERDMRRDERRGNNEQTIQAVELARRLGVRPDPSQLGWTSPDHINPLLDAAVQEHTLTQQDAGRQRATAELQQRMQRIKLAEAGVLPPSPGQDDLVAFQRGQQDRALGDKRQGVADQTAEARLAAAKNEATWNSPTMRSVRGVADWVGDMGKEAVRSAGRQKPTDQSWRQGDMGFMSRDLGDGFSASRDPAGTVTIVGPTGQTLTAEQYQQMRSSLGQAVGMPGNPGVDTTAAPIPLGGWTQDKEAEFQGGLIKKAIVDGKTFAGSRTWKPDGSPVLSQVEVAYEQTLPPAERAALAQAMSSSNYTIRAKASAKLNADATAWANANRK